VTFKYGLGAEFIDVLKVLHKLGLDRTEKVDVGGVPVSPRDVVAACLPDPATLGPVPFLDLLTAYGSPFGQQELPT
jgi:saccharopine dehydrogenase-like NADP-dependent oxidoreductase